jgi:hypothetical protein
LPLLREVASFTADGTTPHASSWRSDAGEALRAATAGGLRSALLVAVVSVAGVVITLALRPAGRDRLADHA